jgi:hypothetical protein
LEEIEQTNGGKSKDQIVGAKITKMKRREKQAFCRGFSEKWLSHYKET